MKVSPATGSKVRLRGGGPVMTVRGIGPNGHVMVFWQRGLYFEEYEISAAALDLIAGPSRESLN